MATLDLTDDYNDSYDTKIRVDHLKPTPNGYELIAPDGSTIGHIRQDETDDRWYVALETPSATDHARIYPERQDLLTFVIETRVQTTED